MAVHPDGSQRPLSVRARRARQALERELQNPQDTRIDAVSAPSSRWWWEFHQAVVALVYAVMVWPTWIARGVIGGQEGNAVFVAVLAAAAILAVTLRLHRVVHIALLSCRARLARARAMGWVLASDALFATALVVAGVLVNDTQPGLAVPRNRRRHRGRVSLRAGGARDYSSCIPNRQQAVDSSPCSNFLRHVSRRVSESESDTSRIRLRLRDEGRWHASWTVAQIERPMAGPVMTGGTACGEILLIEDRNEVRQGLAQLLELHGYMVTEVADADRGMRELASAAERLRARCPRSAAGRFDGRRRLPCSPAARTAPGGGADHRDYRHGNGR